MKIESIEQAHKEIYSRYNKIYGYFEYFKPNAIDRRLLNDLKDLFKNESNNPRFLIKKSFALGRYSETKDIFVSLYCRCIEILLSAHQEIFEEKVFYPNIASDLMKVDGLFSTLEELRIIELNY